MIDLLEINYFAVLLATLATMMIGFLWYSPALFGNLWMKEIGLNKEDISSGGPMTYVLTALTALVGSFFLALLLTLFEERTIMSGLTVAIIVAISISAKIGMNFLFESKTKRLYFITIGYHIVAYIVSGIILGIM
ncbi:DUF1761 domain-containing protein [Bacillus sp. MRMR6]|uniref:DUF1761 domain-containing protein n=1 Tax=Bacillus sp. MRMR6 TaxID=1928617 RepID=UPI0009526B99|nr:DUF1761 domain-containing protein [Bacillus sp. MRMR6]OLS33877.1 hypothetical protein BTR25_23740 [Bacillus sp. MRMR6]